MYSSSCRVVRISRYLPHTQTRQVHGMPCLDGLSLYCEFTKQAETVRHAALCEHASQEEAIL